MRGKKGKGNVFEFHENMTRPVKLVGVVKNSTHGVE